MKRSARRQGAFLRAGVEIEAAGLAAERHHESAHQKDRRGPSPPAHRGRLSGVANFRRSMRTFHFVAASPTPRGNACSSSASPDLSRPLHHSASARVSASMSPRAPRISALTSSASRTSTRRDPLTPSAPVRRPRRRAPLSCVASPRRQPQALSEARGRDRRWSGCHGRVVLPFNRPRGFFMQDSSGDGRGGWHRHAAAQAS